jgi:hypothetical protein
MLNQPRKTAIVQSSSAGRDQVVLGVLEDIKALWDAEGFGSDEAISEPLYARLQAAIQILDRSVQQQ